MWQDGDASFRTEDEAMEEDMAVEDTEGLQVRGCRNSSGSSTATDEEQPLLTKEVLLNGQREDTVVSTVIRWLEQPDLAPKNNTELNSVDPEIQELYSQRQSLQMIDGILYRNYERPDATIQYQQVIVPHALRREFLQYTHGGLINGHFGVEKSREKLKQIAYWKGWTEDVRLFVAQCSICNQYRKGPKGRRGQMQQALACAPMQKVHIDLTGPHVTSRHGNKYILMAICAFTKYLIAVPIREKTSITVARALVRHVYLVHGTPEILVHDQGGEFWSQVMKDLAKLLDIQVSMITSHRPQSNGVVERVHQTMHTVFAKIASTNQRDWCELTSHVCFAYNTAVHASSTYSPYYLLHLRHPKTPLELLIEQPTAAATQSNDEYVQQTAERMRQTYAVVRDHLKASFDRNKKRYDSRVKSSHFEVGDFVYYYVPKNHYGKNRKWAMDNRGPYRVER